MCHCGQVFQGEHGGEYVASDIVFSSSRSTVFSVDGLPRLLLVVPSKNRRGGQWEESVRAHVSVQMDELARKQLMWPTDIVRSGQTVGYVAEVPIAGVTLGSAFPKSASISWNRRIRIAANLCTAVRVAHEQGVVLGDLCSENILVNTDTCQVFLLDQHRMCLYRGFDGGNGGFWRTYCSAGISEYLSPSVQRAIAQGDCLGNPSRGLVSRYSDRFALSVNLFALFFGGAHPYDHISRGKHAVGNMAIPREPSRRPLPIGVMCGRRPRFSMKRRTLPIFCYEWKTIRIAASMRQLFYDAFAEGNSEFVYPSPEQWQKALSDMRRRPRALVSYACDCVRTLLQGRRGVRENAPSDVLLSGGVGNPVRETYSSRRVFWRVTMLVALCCGATWLMFYPHVGAFATSIISKGAVGIAASSWPKYGAVFPLAGALSGALAFNAFASRHRQSFGFSKRQYIWSALCSFLCSVAFLLISVGEMVGEL